METVELPGTITVHDPEPVIAHMASYREWVDQHDMPFEITCLGGILVCRR
ncbi:hypothetical protein [Streptomyces sp. NPDC005322]